MITLFYNNVEGRMGGGGAVIRNRKKNEQIENFN